MQELTKKFAAILYIPLTLPSLILFVFAFMQTPIEWLFVGIGLVLLLFNAWMLRIVYTWLQRMAADDGSSSEQERDGEEA